MAMYATGPPEVFSLSEVVLAAHRSLGHKLRRSEDGPERNRTCRLLRSFVPRLVRQDVASRDASRRVREARGAVLFADASGFTALTQSLCANKDGAERLTGILNEFFGVLIELVDRHNGDVVQFSGDALTVLWRCAEGGGEEHSSSDSGGLAATEGEAVVLACACAVAMCARAASYAVFYLLDHRARA